MTAYLVGFSIAGLYVALPLSILVLSELSEPIRKAGPIVLCYAAGIALGQTGVFGSAARPVLNALSTVTVAISIPLMLFSVNLRSLRTLTGKAGLSMILAFVSVMLVSVAGYLLFAGTIPEGWKIAGLLVGVYTGGTPNLAAIQTALNVDFSLYLAVHTSDVILGALYLLFMVTIAKRLFSRFLPAYPSSGEGSADAPSLSLGSIRRMVSRRKRLPLGGALILAVVIVGIGGLLADLVPGESSTLAAILAITTLSLAAASVPAVRDIDMTFHLGEYVILVFCTVVGSMTDLSQLAGAIPQVFLYVATSIFGTLLLHLLLCRLFSVDADTMIVTSASAILSPPFVAMIAVGIRNRDVVVAGITTGIIGYAAGNYLGILIAHLARLLG